MTKTIDFIYDFGSPNAYLVHKVLPDLAARHGADIRYCPVLLGGVFKATGNKSPALGEGVVPAKVAYLRREMQRFVNRHDLPFVWNPHFPIMSIHLMRGAIHAQGKPWEAAYIDAVFKACWVSGDNMSDPDTIRRELAAEDLPAAEIMDAIQQPAIKTALFEATELAVRRGCFGAPTMFVGDEMFFGKDSLGEIEEALSA